MKKTQINAFGLSTMRFSKDLYMLLIHFVRRVYDDVEFKSLNEKTLSRSPELLTQL